MAGKKIIMLAGEGASTHIVFHALDNVYGVEAVVLEKKENRKVFIKRRIKRLGIFTVVGQIMFQMSVVPILTFFSKKKMAQFLIDEGLNDAQIPDEKITSVSSVNEAWVMRLLQEMKPDVVVVNGTRIISKKILSVIACPIINTHAGITPMYRGVHGAYWALVKKDPSHCGVTVHLVDAGIDTGHILYQQVVSVNRADNFVTYPSKQLAVGIPLLIRAVNDALEDKISIHNTSGKSKLWYHPTIGQYFYHLFFQGVK